MSTVTPFPARRVTTETPNLDALAFVRETMLPELLDVETLQDDETRLEFWARRAAAFDILDDLLEEVALAADEAELLGGAA